VFIIDTSRSNSITIEKTEEPKKRGKRWILYEEYYSYSPELYYTKFKKLILLPSSSFNL
jgi:hypothetical protein